MYLTAIFLILAAAIIANVLLVAVLYFLPYRVVNALRAVFAPNKPAWSPSWWVRAAIAVAILVAVPMLLNSIHRYERAALLAGDKPWQGSLSEIGTLALLTDSFEDKHWPIRGECGPRRCRSLLYQHLARAVLIGSPPPVGSALDPSAKVTRYHIEHRPWCPPLKYLDHPDYRDPTELMSLAEGDCLVAEPATLAEADVIVVDQSFDPPARPLRNTVHEWLTGGQLSLYQRAGNDWQELSRHTTVGGSDWLVPMLVGPLNRNLFGALMFGGGMVGFMTSRNADAEPPDLNAALDRWHLTAAANASPAESVMASVARKVLADTSIPASSAAMQYLGNYAWWGKWHERDRQLQKEIIGDLRVTYFPLLSSDQVTPSELAAPIIDRIVRTQLAEGNDKNQLAANRYAVERLATAFALLPPCAATPLYVPLHDLARDPVTRLYAGPMFSRLADAGPPAVEDLADLIKTSLSDNHSGMALLEWQKWDKPAIEAALKGLIALGPRAKVAAPVVIAALQDPLATDFTYRDAPYEWKAMEALIRMGELETLRQMYAGKPNARRFEEVLLHPSKITSTECTR
jgi:hypothetical protein